MTRGIETSRSGLLSESMSRFASRPATIVEGQVSCGYHNDMTSRVTTHPCWLLIRLRSCSGPWIPAFAGMTGNTPGATPQSFPRTPQSFPRTPQSFPRRRKPWTLPQPTGGEGEQLSSRQHDLRRTGARPGAPDAECTLDSGRATEEDAGIHSPGGHPGEARGPGVVRRCDRCVRRRNRRRHDLRRAGGGARDGDLSQRHDGAGVRRP